MPNVKDLALRLGWPEEVMADALGVALVPEMILPEVGTPISIREASRKYGIGADTISRWVSHPDLTIHIIQEPTRGGQKLVDERDLCLVIREWRTETGKGNGQGKRNHSARRRQSFAAMKR